MKLVDFLTSNLGAKAKVIQRDSSQITDKSIIFPLDDREWELTFRVLPPKLEFFGIAPGDVVRFREKPGGNWKLAKVRGSNTDGSLELIQTSSGSYRSIHPEFIERKGRGKRGGDIWSSITG